MLLVQMLLLEKLLDRLLLQRLNNQQKGLLGLHLIMLLLDTLTHI